MEGEVFRKVADFEKVAARKLSPETLGYISSAAGELSLEENVKAFKRWRFRPRLLRNVREIDTTTTVLGSKLRYPICISPTAFHQEVTGEGEVATAKAAQAIGIGMTLSMLSNRSMEDVVRQAPDCIRWAHLQVTKDRDFLARYIRKAEEHGFTGFIVTVDQPVIAQRVQKTADGKTFDLRLQCRGENLQPFALVGDGHGVDQWYREHLMEKSSDWGDIVWIKSCTSLPVAVKGVLTAEMAEKALNCGVDAIFVSNHGGRQLDPTFATIDSLSEVVRAVNGRCDVYMDGGIRSGNDIAKAIALGAKAVFIGRPILWGLAVDGANGAQKLLEMLATEFEVAMRLLGVTSLKELQTTPNLVVHENYLLSKF